MRSSLYALFFAITLLPWQVEANLWRLDLDLNFSTSLLDRREDGERFKDQNIRQERLSPKLTLGWMPLVSWLYLESDIEYFPRPLSSTEGLYTTGWMQSNRLGIVLPARPFNVSLVGEYYHGEMSSKGDDFGHGPISGAHLYPLIDYSLPGGSRFFIKYPLIKKLGRKEELTAGLHLRLSGQAAPYPINHYQKSWVLKLEYSDVTIKERDKGTIDYRTRSWMVGIGRTF